MTFDFASYDTSGYDQIFITSISGLMLMKCQNWDEGSSHGGAVGTGEVDFLFDDIADSENLDGATDYRKAFVYASETDVPNKVFAPVLTINSALNSRLSVTIAAGTDTDTMADKPADGSFASSLVLDIYAGQSKAVWLKRTITSTTGPVYYKGQGIAIQVSDNE